MAQYILNDPEIRVIDNKVYAFLHELPTPTVQIVDDTKEEPKEAVKEVKPEVVKEAKAEKKTTKAEKEPVKEVVKETVKEVKPKVEAVKEAAPEAKQSGNIIEDWSTIGRGEMLVLEHADGNSKVAVTNVKTMSGETAVFIEVLETENPELTVGESYELSSIDDQESFTFKTENVL